MTPRTLALWGCLGASAMLVWATPVEAQIGTGTPRDAAAPTAEQVALSRVDARARQLSRRVAGQLHLARQEGLERQARCLDRTLTQVHAVSRTLEHRSAGWTEPDPRTRRLMRLVLRSLDRRLRALDAQASACLGGPGALDRRTVVVTERPEMRPEDDPWLREDRSERPGLPPPR